MELEFAFGKNKDDSVRGTLDCETPYLPINYHNYIMVSANK